MLVFHRPGLGPTIKDLPIHVLSEISMYTDDIILLGTMAIPCFLHSKLVLTSKTKTLSFPL